MSKADFILGLPLDVPAVEVMKRGAARGISLSMAHIHTVRSQARTKARKSVPAKVEVETSRRKAPSNLEQRLLETAAELGLVRALKLITDLRSDLLH